MDAEVAPVIPSPTIAMHKSRLRGKGKAKVAARPALAAFPRIVLHGCTGEPGGAAAAETIRRDRVVTAIRE